VRRSCPSCGTDRAAAVVSVTASSVVRGNGTYHPDACSLLGIPPDASYPIVACMQCHLVYAQELPDERFLATLYRDVIAGPPAKTSEARSWTAHQLQLASALLVRVAADERHPLLDFGCGDGTIVKALHAAGVPCLGFEPHPRESADDRITDSMARVREAAPFAGIILSAVLAPGATPRSVLSECRDLLVPGGWLCVSVPDFAQPRIDSIVRDVNRGRPVTRELNPWEHLNYFSPSSLAAMLGQACFRVEAEPARDFGFRSSAAGVRRITNTVRSLGRMIAHAIRPRPGSTTVFAQKA
jgi:SAM-dependent methyltransferase